MNYKSRIKLIRKYWEAQRAYVVSGFPRSEQDRLNQERLKERLQSAEAKLERNGITHEDAYEEKIRQGW